MNSSSVASAFWRFQTSASLLVGVKPKGSESFLVMRWRFTDKERHCFGDPAAVPSVFAAWFQSIAMWDLVFDQQSMNLDATDRSRSFGVKVEQSRFVTQFLASRFGQSGKTVGFKVLC